MFKRLQSCRAMLAIIGLGMAPQIAAAQLAAEPLSSQDLSSRRASAAVFGSLSDTTNYPAFSSVIQVATVQEPSQDDKSQGENSKAEQSQAKKAMDSRDDEGKSDTSAKSDGTTKLDSSTARKLEVSSLIGPMPAAPAMFSKLRLHSAFSETLNHAESTTAVVPQPLGQANQQFTWAAPNFYHQPLYFEQPYLERFGAGPHRALQPWTSALGFYSRIPLLPFAMLKQPPTSRDYTLGYKRPGDCVNEVPLVDH